MMDSFLCYYKLILGPVAIQTFGEHRDLLKLTSPKLTDLVHSDQFSMLLFTVLDFCRHQNVRGTRGPITWTSRKLEDLVHSG